MGENSTSVRVAIVGVGNCASSLVQGVEYYKDADATTTVPGLMHVAFGKYHVRDVKFVAAFDVDAKKVGFDLSEAINASENNTIKIADVPPTGITVQRGHTLDGIGKYYSETIELSDAEPVDIVQTLKDAEVDVLVSYLPVGSDEADKFYAQCCIDAGVAFVNALPVFIASDPVWAKKFTDAGVPIVGDDIKSQVGATITHRVMAKLFEDRGVVLDRTYQLNVGGNMDFKNMLERERLESKKVSKTQAVTSNLEGPLAGKVHDRNVHIGPSDYVQWLDDRKWAYVRLEGRAFGDAPLNLEYKLEVWDSPNSAGIIIDAIRAAKIAKDRGLGGPILPASAYLMKSPPVQMADDKARTELEAFIIGASNSALRTHRAVSESSDSLTATVVFTCHSSGHTSYHRQRQHLHAYASGIHGHPHVRLGRLLLDRRSQCATTGFGVDDERYLLHLLVDLRADITGKYCADIDSGAHQIRSHPLAERSDSSLRCTVSRHVARHPAQCAHRRDQDDVPRIARTHELERRLTLGERTEEIGLRGLHIRVEVARAQRLPLAETGIDDHSVETAEFLVEFPEDREDVVVPVDVQRPHRDRDVRVLGEQFRPQCVEAIDCVPRAQDCFHARRIRAPYRPPDRNWLR